MTKFNGPPGLYVRIANKYVQRATGVKGLAFNESGEYQTENDLLIKLLSQHYEVVTQESVEEFHCKKCDFKTENKGELMQHYKKVHPKNNEKPKDEEVL